jgi:DNA-directed RNA polymerase subunit L
MQLFEETEGLIKLTIIDEDHTLGNIIRSHFLYQLELELVNSGIKGDNFVIALQDSMSQYKVPHPLDNKLEILLKVPSALTLDNIKKGLDYTVNDDEFISYRNTLVLLDYVLGNINKRFTEPLLNETEKRLEEFETASAEAAETASAEEAEDEEEF